MRFSLRALLVVVTLVCVGLFVGTQVLRIERAEFFGYGEDMDYHEGGALLIRWNVKQLQDDWEYGPGFVWGKDGWEYHPRIELAQ